MPDGQTHFRWWKRCLPVALGVSAGMTYIHPVLGVTNAVGYLMGAMMDGDLDQIGLSSSEGRMMRTFKIAGVAWVMYWMPYAYILPHRSFWSHFPFISTAIRLAYLLAPFICLAYYLDVLYYIKNPLIIMGMIGVWDGLSWADAIHYTLDVTHKERRKR